MPVARVAMVGGGEKEDVLSTSLSFALHESGWRVIRCEHPENWKKCVDVARETVGKCMVLATFEPCAEVGAWAFDMVWQVGDFLPESFDEAVSAGRAFVMCTPSPADVAEVVNMARWE